VGGVVLGRDVIGRTALQDCTMEEPLRAGRAEERAHAHGARRLAEDRHVLGVAPERLDVVAHPFECGDLVAQPDVRRSHLVVGTELAKVQESECAEAVVEGDHDDVSAPRKVRPVVEGCGTGSHHESAAVNPDHDRPATVVRLRRPYVEIEAVLALSAQGRADQTAIEQGEWRDHGRRLGRGGAELEGAAHSLPRLGWLRRAQAELADGRLRIRNPAEYLHRSQVLTFQPACTRLHLAPHGA
jgi:hypothetical protein